MVRGYKTDRRGWAQSRARMKSWKNFNQYRGNLPWLPGEDISLLKLRDRLCKKTYRIGKTRFSVHTKIDIIYKLGFEHGRSFCAIQARLHILDQFEEMLAERRRRKKCQTPLVKLGQWKKRSRKSSRRSRKI
jgi:hypothetical protein